jgi:DNA-binding MarR family transcriptional regulator
MCGPADGPPVAQLARVPPKMTARPCFNLRRVTRAMTQFFDAGLRRHGIRTSQAQILLALKAQNRWNMAELSSALGMERTTLVRNLQPLQRGGLVKAGGSGRGGRVELAITAKAEDKLRT